MNTKEKFFQNLYTDNFSSIYKYVFRLTNNTDDAYDIVQDVFLEAFKKSEILEYHPNIKGWLYKTAGYKFKQFAAKRNYVLLLEEYSDMLPAPSEPSVDYDIFKPFLKQSELDLLITYYEHGYSLDEIAASMHISKPALKMRIQRIIKKIKRHFKK